MKRVLFLIIVAGTLVTNAMAWWIPNASVPMVHTRSDGTTVLFLRTSTKTYNYVVDSANADGKKAIVAIALTALTANKNVNAIITNGKISDLSIIQ